MEEETLDLTPLYGVLEEYRTQRGAVIPVLQKAQKIYGFLPPEVLTIALTKLPVLGTIRVISALLMVGGVAWALININSLPMVVDAAPQDRLGTYTGLYYFFSTLSAIVGPISNGWVVQLTGNNYNAVMLLGPVFMVVALACMWGVRKGEALVSASVTG